LKILDKSLWGKKGGLTIVNQKNSASTACLTSLDEVEILNTILAASNYEALIKEAYYTVPEGWQDDIATLEGLHHTIVDGALVPHHGQCKGLIVQHQDDSATSVAHAERHCKALGINILKQRTEKHFVEGEEIRGNKFVVHSNVTLKNNVEEGIAATITSSISKYSLMPTIAAIHSGKTGNNHRYVGKYLQGDIDAKPYPTGIYSYTQPFNKPILLNHDSMLGEPLGRVKEARYVVAGEGGGTVYIMPEITNQAAIEKILDTRYLTVSVGSTTDSVVCNICGTDWMQEGFCDHYRFEHYDEVVCQRYHGVCNICGAEGECEHVIGKKYDDVEAEWILGQIWFDECSFVNVPADASAFVIDTGEKQEYIPEDYVDLEAYLELDNELYNINQQEEVQNLKHFNYLSVKNFKEGGLSQNMKTIEELKRELEEATGKHDQLTTELESLKSTNTSLEEEKVTLETKVTESDSKIEALEAEKATLTTERDTLLGNKEELTTSNILLVAEKETLSEANIQLAKENRMVSAERVIDLKIALGEELDREDELQKLTNSEEDLKSLIDGLLEDFNKYDFQGNKLDDPTGNTNGNGTEEVTMTEMLTTLLGGGFKSDRRSE